MGLVVNENKRSSWSGRFIFTPLVLLEPSSKVRRFTYVELEILQGEQNIKIMILRRYCLQCTMQGTLPRTRKVFRSSGEALNPTACHVPSSGTMVVNGP